MTYADLNGDGEVTPGEIIEENNYYPFGLKHQGYNELAGDVHKYKFLNREYQPELGLNTIATDYRHYDAALGRFNNMDALSELAPSQTPYRYGFNNPVYWTDPTGLFETEQQANRWMARYSISGSVYLYDGVYWVYSNGVHYYMDGGLLHFYYNVSDGGDGVLDSMVFGSNSGRPVGGAGGSSSSGSSGSPAGNGPGGPSGAGPGGPSNGAGPGGPGGPGGSGPAGQDIDWAQINRGVASFGIANTVKNGLIDTAILLNAEMSAKEFSKLSAELKAAKTTAALGKFGSNYLKVFKGAGYIGAGANTVHAGIQLIENPTAGNATRLAVQGAAIGAAFIPGVGWAISLGIGTADMIWGDQFYEWIDNR